MAKTRSPTILAVARSPKQLGEAMRRQRRRLQFTQASLGERAGLRQATVSALESGEARLDTLMQLLAALGLELVVRVRGGDPTQSVEDIF